MKLHLRDLFWLILLVAIVSAWWLDRSQLAGRLPMAAPRARQPGAAPLFENKSLPELTEEWERMWFEDIPSHLQDETHRGVI